MTVREARDGDAVVPGVALVAPGDRDMEVKRSGARYIVKVTNSSPSQHPRPHIDVLFHSVARHAGPNAVGVILTGMGADGALGLSAMRRAGARTLAQDEDSCVVFGMPKEAIRLGAAEKVVSLQDMPARIIAALAAKRGNGPSAAPRPMTPATRQLDRAVSNRSAPGR
jgi:two-component system chemotaxis response regulator CheB